MLIVGNKKIATLRHKLFSESRIGMVYMTFVRMV